MEEPKYTSVYYRKSDNRKFLGKQVVPGQMRLWDTIDNVFTDCSKETVRVNYLKDATNRKRAFNTHIKTKKGTAAISFQEFDDYLT